MRAPLYSFFILFREVDLENISPCLTFANTSTADGKHPDQDSQNLPLPIQMQLS